MGSPTMAPLSWVFFPLPGRPHDAAMRIFARFLSPLVISFDFTFFAATTSLLRAMQAACGPGCSHLWPPCARASVRGWVGVCVCASVCVGVSGWVWVCTSVCVCVGGRAGGRRPCGRRPYVCAYGVLVAMAPPRSVPAPCCLPLACSRSTLQVPLRPCSQALSSASRRSTIKKAAPRPNYSTQ